MDILIVPIIQILILLISIYNMLVIAAVVFDWLRLLGILDMRNRYVLKVSGVLTLLTYPVLSRIRKVIRPIGNIDISPFVLILALVFVEEVLARIAYKVS